MKLGENTICDTIMLIVIISCFWYECGSISLSYLTYTIWCNQYSACNHSHNMHSVAPPSKLPYLGCLDAQVSVLCLLVPRPHPSCMVLLWFVHFLPLNNNKKKKPFWPSHFEVTCRTRNTKLTLCGLEDLPCKMVIERAGCQNVSKRAHYSI